MEILTELASLFREAQILVQDLLFLLTCHRDLLPKVVQAFLRSLPSRWVLARPALCEVQRLHFRRTRLRHQTPLLQMLHLFVLLSFSRGFLLSIFLSLHLYHLSAEEV